MKKILLITFLLLISNTSIASPIISGISNNEINIDAKFNGAKILLFGAKGEAGNIVIAVRGPKRNFLVTKKEKLLGIWYNGERVKFKESPDFYALFSTFQNQVDSEQIDNLLSNLELGKERLKFETSNDVAEEKRDEFRVQLVSGLEAKKLYAKSVGSIDFLDETLFKVMLDFPKNISRGTYTVEIYLIDEGALLSFQSIPIYVNQVGLSARILDFSYQQSFLYGLLAVAVALIFGWFVNYIFARFFGK